MTKYEQQILDNIENFGCHVTSVFDPNELEPNFTYSTGITKRYAKPEVIVMGVRPELGQSLVNEYKRRIAEGIQFEFNVPYLGFLNGFSVYFGPVIKAYRDEYLLSSCWLYKNEDFEVVQLIYPDTSGNWPWETSASDWFIKNQPILSVNLGSQII